MKQTSGPARKPAATVIKDIRRTPRRRVPSAETIRIVQERLCGEDSIAELSGARASPTVGPRTPGRPQITAGRSPAASCHG